MTTNDELTELIGDLVSIETENPPGNEARCTEFIVEWFAERGIDTDTIEQPYPDRPQVVASVGEGSPVVVLNGHVDVVPAGDRERWSHPPYEATIEDGRLYGRGSVDMKAGVALAMCTAVDLGERIESDDLSGTVIVQAAIGEETAEPGTEALIDAGYGGEYAVVLEPTGMKTATSEKGLAWYEITIDGEPAHASRPDRGANAISRARPVLDALERYDEEVRERTDDLVGQAYATVTKLEAGTKENVVPERATITIDRRFLPEEDASEIDAEIDTLLAAVANEHRIGVSWERTRTYDSAAIPTDSPLAEVFREHSETVANVSPAPWGIQASTDVRNFVAAGIEAITWGPGDLDQAHAYDEYIDTEAATTGFEVLKRSVETLLKEAP